MLKEGITNTISSKVTNDNTAKTMGSGALDVYATPSMVALMEKCCFEMVQPYLEEGQGTVGTSLNIEHLSASPVGMEVSCTAILTAVEGRKLIFTVEAFDAAGLIGKGTHERFVIYSEKFQAKANSKL